jgi:hypothetical protein
MCETTHKRPSQSGVGQGQTGPLGAVDGGEDDDDDDEDDDGNILISSPLTETLCFRISKPTSSMICDDTLLSTCGFHPLITEVKDSGGDGDGD